MNKPPIAEFDIVGLYEALDTKRCEQNLSWRAVADEIWEMSYELNRRRHDHPISPSTLTGMAKRDATSCQHALFMLRWLDRAPESFLTGGEITAEASLPPVGPDRRLRWDLAQLYDALDTERRETNLKWPELARELRCTANQLTGIRTARFATGMKIAMRIVQWLHRPASDFIYAAKW